jgi:flagellar assembly factor FliW
MEIQTEVFGKIQISEEQIISFAEGLSKVKTVCEYVLLPVEDELFYCLQAKDYSEVSFFVIDPFVVTKDFRLQVDAEELLTVGCESDVLPESVLVLCPFIKGNAAGDFKVDFQSPILINRLLRLGKQLKNRWGI